MFETVAQMGGHSDHQTNRLITEAKFAKFGGIGSMCTWKRTRHKDRQQENTKATDADVISA